MLNNGQYAPLSIRSRPGRHRPPRSYLTGVLSSYSPLHGPVSGITLLSTRRVVDSQERRPMTDEAISLNETIHQSTRLRIMTLFVSRPETDHLAYGFI